MSGRCASLPVTLDSPRIGGNAGEQNGPAATSFRPAQAKAASARPFVAIEMSARGETLLFDEPVEVVTTNEFEEVGPTLARLETAGRHVSISLSTWEWLISRNQSVTGNKSRFVFSFN